MKSGVDEINQTIPEKETSIEIHPFNGTEYLIQHTILGYQVKANKVTIQLLDLVDGVRSVQTISEEFERRHNISITCQDLHSILYENLSRYGIIRDSNVLEKRKRAKYLMLSFIFLREDLVRSISKYLAFLFHKWIFLPSLLLMTIFISWTYLSNYQVIANNSQSLISLSMVLYIIVFRVGSIFHEFGHAAACSRFGAKPGGIGFGFYLLIPVFFVDVSDIWKLPAKKRLIVNFGGIYFEMLLASICLIIYHVNDQLPFLIIPTLMIIGTLYNLNPLIRLDGYWVMVDLFRIPNLRRDAQKEMLSFFKTLIRFRLPSLTVRKASLVVYGILSSMWVVILLISIFYFDPHAIGKFPEEVFRLSECLFDSFEPNCFQRPTQWLVPLIFYLIVMRLATWPLIGKYVKRKFPESRDIPN